MLHLCVDARLYDATGIGTHLKAILPFLKDFQITLLVNRRLEYPHRQIEMASEMYSFQEQIELPRKIPSCDLFWTPHFNIPLSPIRARKRLVTIHDVYHLAHFSSLTVSQKIYAKLMINAALRYADYVMTDSLFSALEIEKYCFKPKNFGIVPSSAVLHPRGIEVEGVPEKYILYVGNLKPHKNIERLIEAHALIKEAPPLVIVGKQFGKIELPPHVHYAGYVPDDALPALYARAELFVFPSTYEGFGIPPLEAMACGCPVVASKTASIPEVCGEAVEYIDPLSVSSIKQGIERLLHDPERRKELIRKGKEQIKVFTPEKSAQKFMEVVHACCSRP